VHWPLRQGTVASSPDDVRAICLADSVFRDRYDGWTLLDRGSYATVVRTFSRDAGREIALKVFVDVDPETLRRVRDEVFAAQSLATPLLVQAYSLFDRGRVAWFEMELVDGPNLQQELDRLAATGHRMPLPRAIDVGLAVSRCLWHAHRNGILHRDVKPANILLPGSGRPAAKLTDFGIARLTSGSGVTPDGSITGTPRFASPEALGGEVVGPAHDVFGLSVTLYMLFSGGRHPFGVHRDTSIAALRRQETETRPEPLGRWSHRLSPAVRGVVMQGLAPRPESRPSAQAVVLALEDARAAFDGRAPTSGGRTAAPRDTPSAKAQSAKEDP
jgi:serine/threonine protein kinase